MGDINNLKLQKDAESTRANTLQSELSNLRVSLENTQSELQKFRTENVRINDVIRVKDTENKRLSHEANKRPSRIHYHHVDENKLGELESLIKDLRYENSQ